MTVRLPAVSRREGRPSGKTIAGLRRPGDLSLTAKSIPAHEAQPIRTVALCLRGAREAARPSNPANLECISQKGSSARSVGSDNNAFVEDATRPQIDYANCDTTPFQHFFMNITYLVPGIKTPGQLLEGWEVNSNINVVGATPFNAADTNSDLAGLGTGKLLRGTYWTMLGNPNNFSTGGPIPCYGVTGSKFGKNSACIQVQKVSGTTVGQPGYVVNMSQACVAAATSESVSNGGLWNVSSNPSVLTTDKDYNGLAALGNIGCYFENGSAIVPPAQGTFGTMRRNTLTDKPFHEWDISLTKNWKFRERLQAQFRAEFFNVLNSTEYSAPSGNPNSHATFGMSQSVPNSNNPFNGTGGPREIQLGMKFTF